MDLREKTYVICGASSGIGKNVAEYLTTKCDANVILVARREDVLCDICNSLRGNNSYIAIDLSDFKQIKGLLDFCKGVGKVDGLVYTAGVAPLMSVNDNDMKCLQETLNVNVLAFVEIMHLFMNNNLFNLGASVVAVSSTVTTAVTNRQSAYAASKSALNTYVRYIARETLNKFRVNAVIPGAVETELLHELRLKSTNFDENTKKQQPLGIIPPDRVSKLIAFLLSDDSDFITGSLYTIDGGYSLR